MKVGDLVRIRADVDCIRNTWLESLGELGLIVGMTDRIYIPAANVFVLDEIAEFDLEELELVNESR